MGVHPLRIHVRTRMTGENNQVAGREVVVPPNSLVDALSGKESAPQGNRRATAVATTGGGDPGAVIRELVGDHDNQTAGDGQSPFRAMDHSTGIVLSGTGLLSEREQHFREYFAIESSENVHIDAKRKICGEDRPKPLVG